MSARPAAPEPQTLAESIAIHARATPDANALIVDGRTISYAELDRDVERAADGFAAAGVRSGDRVALFLPNGLDFVTTYYGALRLGAVVVALNPMYRDREIASILADAQPAIAVVDASLYAQAATAFAASSVPRFVVAGDAPTVADERTISWTTFLASGFARTRLAGIPAPHDLAVLCYTSGTTGRAKGAMHSHATLLGNCRQAGSMLRRKPGAADRALVSVPLAHMYGMQTGINGMFRVGGSCVVLKRFDALETLRAVGEHRCTYLLAAPAMFGKWLEVLDDPGAPAFDLRSLTLVTTGTASLPASTIERFQRCTGVAISESYGLTEAGPTTHSNSNGPVDKIGSVGPVVPGVEARLVDAGGREVAPGEPGEIEVRSASVMLGYWNDPAASAAAFRDGWLRTGDVATCDADGYFTIVDRLKDMISVNGFKVWPREIEDALATHPAVREAAAVGVSDASGAERPVAFVILQSGATVSADALRAHVAESLARYKVPAWIEIVDDFPRVSTGKVLRRELQARAAAPPSRGNVGART